MGKNLFALTLATSIICTTYSHGINEPAQEGKIKVLPAGPSYIVRQTVSRSLRLAYQIRFGVLVLLPISTFSRYLLSPPTQENKSTVSQEDKIMNICSLLAWLAVYGTLAWHNRHVPNVHETVVFKSSSLKVGQLGFQDLLLNPWTMWLTHRLTRMVASRKLIHLPSLEVPAILAHLYIIYQTAQLDERAHKQKVFQ